MAIDAAMAQADPTLDTIRKRPPTERHFLGQTTESLKRKQALGLLSKTIREQAELELQWRLENELRARR